MGFKTISSEEAANTAIKRGHAQIKENPGGIMLDFDKSDSDSDILIGVINNRMKWYYNDPIDIMIVSKRKIVKILRYKN